MSSTTASRSTSRAGVAPPIRRRTMHLTGRGHMLVLVLLVLLLLAAFAVGRSASSQATEQVAVPGAAPTQVVVQPGDTLWTLARRVAPGHDPRDVVSQIRRLNHLSSASVQAGRQLLLPAVV